MSHFAIVEKKNHHAVHSIHSSRAGAEQHLKEVVPEYVRKSYYMDKTLRPGDFEVIPYSYGKKKRKMNPANISSEHAALRRMIASPKTTAKQIKSALGKHLKHEENPINKKHPSGREMSPGYKGLKPGDYLVCEEVGDFGEKVYSVKQVGKNWQTIDQRDFPTRAKADSYIANMKSYGKGGSWRTQRKNPVPLGNRAKLEAATKRYELFRDQDSEHVVECESNFNGKPIGKMLAILYTTVRAGKTERYKHDFKKECAPTVIKLGDHHGAPRIRTHGGKFEFTDRGFVDYPSRGSNPSKPDYSTCTEVGKLDGFELLKSDGKIYEVSWPAKERMTLAVSSDGRAIISLVK